MITKTSDSGQLFKNAAEFSMESSELRSIVGGRCRRGPKGEQDTIVDEPELGKNEEIYIDRIFDKFMRIGLQQ